MDESFIYERLKALGGGMERAQYRDISRAFEEVIRYNRSALEELKGALRRELSDVSERFYLYGAVAEAGDVSMFNDFLFPMTEEEAEGSIATVFCQCPRQRMRELFAESQEMTVETEDGTFAITVRMKPCVRLRKKIEELRSVFYENGVYWRTPYLPYTERFADVYCEDFRPESPVRRICFRHKDIPVRTGLIPLWNVEPVSLKCTVFPVPAIDEWNYRHTIRLPFAKDGYVVKMEQAVKHVYMSRDGLEIVSEEKTQRNFDMYRIAVRRDINIPHYPLTSNFRRMRHIDRQADHAARRPGTRAEIGRIVTGYEAGEGLKLTEIVEGGLGEIGAADDPYEFRAVGQEKILLKFHTEEKGFLSEDQAVFLVREVQSYYPQFLVTADLSVC